MNTLCQLQPQFLPSKPLYGDGSGTGWELSPTPFQLSPEQHQDLLRLGPVLWRFVQASESLYRESGRQGHDARVPSWVAGILDAGKPEALLKFGQMKRFKSLLPTVLRPDILLTANGWMICEIDAVPGGIGFTAALNQAYRQSGCPVLEAPEGMPAAFLAMLQALAGQASGDSSGEDPPVLAILVSDEAGDYRQELAWLVEALQPQYPEIHLLHPREVELVRDRLVFTTEAGEEKSIDLIYRFFELFDLPNIPKMELIQYAVKKGFVRCTPPFKPHVEEKALLALLHHPALAPFWAAELGEGDFHWLRAHVPQGWILDPTPLPPQAIIPGLSPGGRALQSFEALQSLSQKERELVIKPSGFSPLAWGSRGVTVGHDVSQAVWQESLAAALAAYPQTPHLLQRFEKPAVQQIQRLVDRQAQAFAGRTRLCPYYFVTHGEPKLVGALATTCPADKKVIHGMVDAILAPCSV